MRNSRSNPATIPIILYGTEEYCPTDTPPEDVLTHLTPTTIVEIPSSSEDLNQNDGCKNNTIYTIVGIVAALVVIGVVVAFVIYKVRKRKENEETSDLPKLNQ